MADDRGKKAVAIVTGGSRESGEPLRRPCSRRAGESASAA
jgi:hypothetical protein